MIFMKGEKKMFDYPMFCNIALYCILGSAIWYVIYTEVAKTKSRKNKK